MAEDELVLLSNRNESRSAQNQAIPAVITNIQAKIIIKHGFNLKIPPFWRLDSQNLVGVPPDPAPLLCPSYSETQISDEPNAYQMLEKYDFQSRVLPQGVLSYFLNQDGSFEVYLGVN
ncbi:hypothetical protein Cni_G21455 [Canna indica]|uniref:Uncharacterized protein n=1 Tax=Canna indica TaxID=4628 RepID=A0AAQ3QKB2_9LILI|nr:hypothetical protein Cni_G21455 [Canna indica]